MVAGGESERVSGVLGTVCCERGCVDMGVASLYLCSIEIE